MENQIGANVIDCKYLNEVQFRFVYCYFVVHTYLKGNDYVCQCRFVCFATNCLELCARFTEQGTARIIGMRSSQHQFPYHELFPCQTLRRLLEVSNRKSRMKENKIGFFKISHYAVIRYTARKWSNLLYYVFIT